MISTYLIYKELQTTNLYFVRYSIAIQSRCIIKYVIHTLTNLVGDGEDGAGDGNISVWPSKELRLSCMGVS